MMFVLDTNVVFELRKARMGKACPKVVVLIQSGFQPLGVPVLNPWNAIEAKQQV